MASKKSAKKNPLDSSLADVEKTQDKKASEINPTVKDPSKKSRRIPVTVLIVVLFIALGFVFYYTNYKSIFVVAQVNGDYIFRNQLSDDLVKRYGPSELDRIITLKLIKDEIKSSSVVVSDEEIDARIAEIEKTLPGMTLEDALAAQNMTVDELREQIFIQAALETHLKDKVSITDSEVVDYITNYGAQMTATDDAGKAEEAKKALTDQKLQQEIGKWVEEIKTKAAITKYI